MTRSSGASVEIAVQPPSRVQVSQWINPPVVARTRDPGLIEDYIRNKRQIFATMTLFTTSMADCTSMLSGNWNASAQLVADSSSSSSRSGGGGSSSSSSSRSRRHEWLYFVFHPVSVEMEGTFSFNIAVSALTLSGRHAGTSQLVGGRGTQLFEVVAHPPRAERPGSSERHVLSTLQAAGLYSPSTA